MKITPELRAFLVSKGWIKSGEKDDNKINNIVLAKLASGDITQKQFARYSKSMVKSGGDVVGEIVNEHMNPVKQALAEIGKKLNINIDFGKQSDVKEEKDSSQEFDLNTLDGVKAYVDSLVSQKSNDGASPYQLLSKAANLSAGDHVRIKSAAELYSTSTKQAICPQRTGLKGNGSEHPNAGLPATYMGSGLDHPSDQAKAIASAYFKRMVWIGSQNKQDVPYGLRMTDHDKDLLAYAAKNCKWTGAIVFPGQTEDTAEDIKRRLLTPVECKALLDDTTSGGIEIAPVEFDEAIILIPVLYGELFPLVDVKPISRGRRIKGGQMSNPTFTSGIAEGAAITPFNTASFITAFDTPIYTAVGAMEIGMDFEEDSPVNSGAVILQKYGEKSLEWLDRVIAVGDGLTEPEGIFTSSAVAVLTSDNGVGGPPTVGDYEGLMFGVPKQFRNTQGSRNVFVASDVSYRRARSIAVGPGDERRVFEMTHGDYMLLDRPYKVQNDIPNNRIGFANLGYYRMYRRLGLTVRNETAGQYLASRNLRLIVVRMRWGGRIELGGAAAIINDGQN